MENEPNDPPAPIIQALIRALGLKSSQALLEAAAIPSESRDRWYPCLDDQTPLTPQQIDQLIHGLQAHMVLSDQLGAAAYQTILATYRMRLFQAIGISLDSSLIPPVPVTITAPPRDDSFHTRIRERLQQALPTLDPTTIAQTVDTLLRGERTTLAGNAVTLSFGEGNSFDQATINVGAVAGGDIITVQLPQPLDPLPAALALFASMPLDHVPEPTTILPPTSRMLLGRNPHFVGRTKDLRNLAHVIADPTPTVIVSAVATGMGGIGKSSVVVEFAYRYGRYFQGGVFWINCADPTAIVGEMAACAVAMGLPVAGLLDADQAAATQRAWRDELPRLLIFDNCEDPQILDQWKPVHGGCRVLVTTRRGDWPDSAGVPIGVLARPESMALIQRLAPHVRSDDTNTIAETLGDLPLALHLAGSYLNRQKGHETPAAYLEQLASVDVFAHDSFIGRALRPHEHLPTKHEQHVKRTFALSFNQLNPDNAIDVLARHQLACLACLAPGELVSHDLLVALLPEGTKFLDGVDALDRLVALGLVDRELDDAVRVHRLIHRYLAGSLPTDTILAAVEDVLCDRAHTINEAGYPSAMQPLLAHLRWLVRPVATRNDTTMAGIATEIADHSYATGAYATAQPLYERALAIREQALGPDHPDTAESLNNLAGLLHATGDYGAARPLYERALTIREQALEPTHPSTATSLGLNARRPETL